MGQFVATLTAKAHLAEPVSTDTVHVPGKFLFSSLVLFDCSLERFLILLQPGHLGSETLRLRPALRVRLASLHFPQATFGLFQQPLAFHKVVLQLVSFLLKLGCFLQPGLKKQSSVEGEEKLSVYTLAKSENTFK